MVRMNFSNQMQYSKYRLQTALSLSIFLIGCGESNNTENQVVLNTPTLPPIIQSAHHLNGIEYISISELSKKMNTENISSRAVVQYYLNRIATLDKSGPNINSIIELNPDALLLADQLDAEKKQGKIRGPLHGIPILLKDNIDTADKMQTTAGSLAMIGQPALNDAFLVQKLRNAGAIILGKTNLSEWSFFRDDDLPSGWSGRGGQTKNPHMLSEDPCGSSSGSAAAVAAGFAPISVGTETDGSIICPSEKNGVVGIRPTLGFISRHGIIPISPAQDTAGPIAKNVYDAALLLNVLIGADVQDKITTLATQHATDFTQYLKKDGLKGKRIGYFKDHQIGGASHLEKALELMQNQGAILIPLEAAEIDHELISTARDYIFSFDFKHYVNKYLTTRQGLKIKTVSDLVAFNKSTPNVLKDGKLAPQKSLESAEKMILNIEIYQHKFNSYKKEAKKSIDTHMSQHQLDAMIGEKLGEFAAVAGYPGITVPSGMDKNLPTGIYFIAQPWQEGKLLAIAYSYEQASQARKNPAFLP